MVTFLKQLLFYLYIYFQGIKFYELFYIFKYSNFWSSSFNIINVSNGLFKYNRTVSLNNVFFIPSRSIYTDIFQRHGWNGPPLNSYDTLPPTNKYKLEIPSSEQNVFRYNMDVINFSLDLSLLMLKYIILYQLCLFWEDSM